MTDASAAPAASRIWYQSFVHPFEQAPYVERLQRLLDAVADAGVAYANAPAGALEEYLSARW